MLSKFLRIFFELTLRHSYFLIFYLKVFFTFRKASKRDIDINIIKSTLLNNFSNYKSFETDRIISPIWKSILNKHKINILKSIENKNYPQLQNIYQNLISSDLCDGVEDKILRKYSFANLRYSLRFSIQFFNYVTSKSIYPLNNLYQPNKNFLEKIKSIERKITYFFSNSFLKNQEKIKYFNTYKVFQYQIPTDYFDHMYFVEFIDDLLNKKSLKYLEIGGGSGFLSELIQYRGYINSVNIDIAPYLLAQNLFLNSSSKFYLSERISSIESLEADFLINQDSFPEIPLQELDKIFKLIQRSKIKKVFSNNHLSENKSQNNFRKFLKEFNYRVVVSVPNPIRKGYLIEYFELIED